jgi:hypothetical protein
MMLTLAVGMGFLVARVAAQHEDHPAGEAPAAGKMMSGGMMSHMPEMMKMHSETTQLVDRLAKSLAAIEAEQNAETLKVRLTEHGALLKELQAKVERESKMMDMMQHMMGATPKSAEHEH